MLRSIKRGAAVAATVMALGLGAASAPAASATGAHLRPGFITYPKAAGLTWRAYMSADSNEVLSVSCRYSTFCLAGDDTGDIVEFNGVSWQTASTALSSGQVNSVSCSPQAFCAAVDSEGYAYTSDVRGGEGWSEGQLHDGVPLTAAGWSSADVDHGGALTSVSCPGLDGANGADIPQFCAAVSSSGDAYIYTGTWGPRRDIDGSEDLVAVSCPSYLFCMAIDQRGYEVTYQASPVPAGQAQDGPAPLGSWHAPVSFSPKGPPTALSCYTSLTASFQDVYDCKVGFSGGRAVTYNNGTWGTKVVVDKAPITALWCTDENMCIAGNQAGKVVGWRAAPNKWQDLGAIGTGGAAIVALSCATSMFCAAVDANGDAFTGS
jgi:hypothetical protein